MTGIEPTCQAIVVGAGIAGMATVTALARKGVAAALIDEGYVGGLVMNVGLIEGSAGHEGQSGADLVDVYLTEALEAGVEYHVGAAESLEADAGLWRVGGLELAAPNIVLATGARLRTLGVPGEATLTGRGVSQCAFCDGGLYRGQDVTVVGGGDAAFQEALHLAELCRSVTVLTRGAAPRARAMFQAKAAAHDNLTIRANIDVLEVLGTGGVDGLRLRDRAAGREETLETPAVFVFVGLDPATDLAPAEAARDGGGALVVDPASTAASLAGLYAVGAARAGHGGAIDDALKDAAAAAEAIAAACS